MAATISKKDNLTKEGRNLVLHFLAAVAIYSVALPLFLLDLWTSIYQEVFFTIYEIPKISKKDYIVIDRHQLSKLNFFQKLNCVYCGYANGTTAWLKAVTNQTELYSCSIKHKFKKLGQEHQSEFYEYKDYQ